MNLVSEPIVVISFFFLFFFDLILLLSWPLFFAAVWSRFHALQHHWWIRALTVFMLFGFAILSYRVRRDYRILYGVAETIVGLVAGWAVLRNLQADRITLTIGLAASVYFMARGIDNFQEGRKLLGLKK